MLQRKAGYREVLQAWLNFNIASRLRWDGVEEVIGGSKTQYDAGKRDLPTLYEAWVFFQLLDLFCQKFDVERPSLAKLFKSEDPFTLVLRQGTHLAFPPVKHKGIRRMNGEFHYNKTFSQNADYDKGGSWTRILRPDYTFTFWPGECSLEEAEKKELVVHIHFDAKYRVESIERLFGEPDTNLDEEKKQQREGNYKRADLLKMHAYRDAIRRSEGAYVIYPGEDSGERFEAGFRELLPGLGAFAIRPLANGDAKGLDEIDKFLDGALDQLTDRASVLEHRRYGISRVKRASAYRAKEDGKQPSSVDIALEDLINRDAEHPLPAQETVVLVGLCKSEEHWSWITSKGLYNFRAGEAKGSLPLLAPRFAEARFILLLNKSGKTAKPRKGLLRVKADPAQGGGEPEILSKAKLAQQGYTGAGHDQYIVFKVDHPEELEALEWDVDELTKFNPKLTGGYDGAPFQLTLDQVLIARKRPPSTITYETPASDT